MIRKLYKLLRRVRDYLSSRAGPEELDHRVSVGHYSYGISKRSFFLVRNSDRVKIGKFCSFAPEVMIIPSGEHNFSGVSTFPFYANLLNKGVEKDTFSKGDVVIGNDVWVGYNATILSGVTIGDGAVIAACAVIVGDVPPYAIVSGVPASIIGYRFTPENIKALLNIRWWDWDLKIISARVNDFYTDIETFIKKYEAE
jgi:acetyltransferase-like isoleucine patch superfamily enzyme